MLGRQGQAGRLRTCVPASSRAVLWAVQSKGFHPGRDAIRPPFLHLFSCACLRCASVLGADGQEESGTFLVRQVVVMACMVKRRPRVGRASEQPGGCLQAQP